MTDKYKSEVILYQTPDGKTRVDVRFEGETAWLNQAQMAELFETTKQNISLHVNNIYKEGELPRGSTVKDYLTVQVEGGVEKKRSLEYYNLAMKMADWVKKLDEYLILMGKGVLKHSGSVSVVDAEEKAEIEFTSYKRELDKNYISDFDKLAKKLLKKTKK